MGCSECITRGKDACLRSKLPVILFHRSVWNVPCLAHTAVYYCTCETRQDAIIMEFVGVVLRGVVAWVDPAFFRTLGGLAVAERFCSRCLAASSSFIDSVTRPWLMSR